MTPVYLNPPPSPFPFVELKEEQNLQLYLSPQQPTASSLSAAPINYFFNSTLSHQDQRVLSPKPHDHKVINSMLMSTHEGSSDMQQASSSSSVHKSAIRDQSAASGGHNLSFGRKEEDNGDSENASDNGSTTKWMPSKMRLMKRMMNNSNWGGTTGSADNNNKPLKFKLHHPTHDVDNETNSFGKTSNNTVRVCSDCNTTTTPLWRSGPRGPKSLCNACGIRQRKARRAMEAAAANGAGVATDTTSSTTTAMKIKVNINKEKKARTSHVAQYKKQSSSPQSQRKLICFKEFALSLSENSALQRVFPQDVEDAAILLMELSCGLVHS